MRELSAEAVDTTAHEHRMFFEHGADVCRKDARPPENTKPLSVIAVVGPTGSRKSELAERLALHYRSEVISADSMQIYRGMDIGTAKVPKKCRRVPYHVIDVIDPGDAYSAALFQRDARAAIGDLLSRGKHPILCGGTGLYVRAALDDFSFPQGDIQDDQIREKYEQFGEEKGEAALYRLLSERDPKSAALIHPNNTRRVVRALEMLERGSSYAQQQSGFQKRETVFPTVFVAPSYPREELYARIDKRVDRMMEDGLLGEVKDLLDHGFRNGLTAHQAIGYKELVEAIDGTTSLPDAVDTIKRSTRRYAKRQLTWFRGDPRIEWIECSAKTPDQIFEEALSIIEQKAAL